jgi:hypothetical protein
VQPDLTMLSVLHLILTELRPVAILLYTFITLVQNTSLNILLGEGFTGWSVGDMEVTDFIACLQGHANRNAFTFDGVVTDCGNSIITSTGNTTLTDTALIAVGLLFSAAVLLTIVALFVVAGAPAFDSPAYLAFSVRLEHQFAYRVVLYAQIVFFVAAVGVGLGYTTSGGQVQQLLVSAVVLLSSSFTLLKKDETIIDFTRPDLKAVRFKRSLLSIVTETNNDFISRLNFAILKAKFNESKELTEMLAAADSTKDMSILLLARNQDLSNPLHAAAEGATSGPSSATAAAALPPPTRTDGPGIEMA